MKRKTWLWAAIAGLLAASCSNEMPVEETGGSELITFTLQPDPSVHTRAAASIVPDGKKLRYIMEVYDDTGTNLTTGSRSVKVVADETTPVSFTWQRPQGSTYKVVFWADLTSDNTDAYYDTTTTGLSNITLKSGNAGNFDGEAFFGSMDVSSTTSAVNSVTLKHAVSQVNLKTTKQLTGFGSVKVTCGEAGNANAPQSSFNAVNGTVGATGATVAMVNRVNPDTAADAGSPYTFHTFYLFAPTAAQGLITMKVEMYSDASGNIPLQPAITIPNVPLRANYKTNVTGDFAQATDALSISCTNDWRGEVGPPSVWDGILPSGNSGGSTFSGGTGADADNAFVIASAEDLAQLAADVNVGQTYNGKYFTLTTDIDLAKHEWTPIGSYIYNNSNNKPFQGIFNGNHHKITNLKIDRSDMPCVGLFGYVKESNAKIEKLHIQGDIKNSYSGKTTIGAAGVIGFAESDPYIEHCSFGGSVQCTNGFTGGLLGYGFAVVIASKNTGNITGLRTGGIVGYTGILIACYNTGTINGTNSAGGIMSDLNNVGTTMTTCYNIGTVTCNDNSVVGALCGNGGSGYTTGDCYVLQSYTNVVTPYEKVFSSTEWPDGTNTGSAWYADASNDGTYTTDAGGNILSGKFWKSIGSWNAGGTPAYPKLWWED